jgi:two-component system response regulator HydG
VDGLPGEKEVEGVEPSALRLALDSPLRLRLVADLLELPQGFSLEQAVLRSSRHVHDVIACLEPLVRWGLLLDESQSHSGRRRYRLKPDAPPHLLQIIREIVESKAEALNCERRVRHRVLAGMIGVNPKMQLVFELIGQMARIDVPVLISGETGTGKELVARAIHELGPRRTAFYGAVNCAVLTETLFESQMFGHARGAFTGAARDHVGLVEQCHGGTLLLDEIGELSLTNQAKLLRVLQENTFTRLGDATPRRSDFRLIAATHRHLASMVAQGSFREDLFYRINVFPIRVPSLRERLDDLPHLVLELMNGNSHRLGSGAWAMKITPEAIDVLKTHSWPGNIRELENVVLRAAVMADGGPVTPEHLPPLGAATAKRAEPEEPPGSFKSLVEVERDHIHRVLAAKKGNIQAAATVLGISRTTLYKKIEEYSLETVTKDTAGSRRAP